MGFWGVRDWFVLVRLRHVDGFGGCSAAPPFASGTGEEKECDSRVLSTVGLEVVAVVEARS